MPRGIVEEKQVYLRAEYHLQLCQCLHVVELGWDFTRHILS
jgi:hypothetical protein